MSTIPSTVGPCDPLQINRAGDRDYVIVRVARHPATSVLVTDFLAAVEAECDAIVIPKSELPEVTADGDTLDAGDHPGYRRDFDHRPEALRRLALVEYNTANPSVDEAQVEALTKVLADVTKAGPLGPEHVARRLVAAGVTVEKRQEAAT